MNEITKIFSQIVAIFHREYHKRKYSVKI